MEEDRIENGSKRYFRAKLLCPHCGEEIVLQIDLTTNAHLPADSIPISQRPRAERFLPHEVALLERMEQSGMIQAFENAVRRHRGILQMPRDIEKMFLGYIRKTKGCIIPRESLDILIAEYGRNAFLNVYATDGIVMVTANQAPILFIPEVFLQQSPSQTDKTKMHLPVPVEQLTEWLRTRNGYVAGRGLMWDEMRGRNAGAFAKPNL